MIWFGLISEVKDSKARVAVDGLTTDYLSVIQFANEYKRSWSPIKVQEQCIVLSPTNDINKGCILRGLYYNSYPSPSTDEDTELTQYSDGTEISYNTSTGELNVNAVKDIILKCEKAVVNCKTANLKTDEDVTIECMTANITANQSAKVDSPLVELGKGITTGVVTQMCPCVLTGLSHAYVSTSVKASI